jgi:outer membrane lipoprotein-sorting protein
VTRSFVRWIPAGVIPVAIIAVAIVVPTAADASPQLPAKSAQDVIAMIANSNDAQFSGTVEQVSDLGFPELPGMGMGAPGGTDAASALELLTGSHTVRVFVGADDSARLQVMDQLAQRDVILSGNEMWTYDSKSNATNHVTVTPEAKAAIDAAGTSFIPEVTSTPADIAENLLGSVDEWTTVEVGDTARVAGRAVYTLTITPKSTETLVASATLAVDSETGLPLSAAIMAVGQSDPAVSVAFSSIEFGEQDASLFTFTAPADSVVTENTITADDVAAGLATSESAPVIDRGAVPTVIGTGWSTIVSIPANLDQIMGGQPMGEPSVGEQGDALAMLDQLTTQVDGGRVVQTSLFSILLADDGRVLLGAVSPDALVAAAQQ